MSQPKPSAFYNADYYGNTETPTANYRNYNENANPHWARPLAEWLSTHAKYPILDLGCAFGHLVREIARVALVLSPDNAIAAPAVGVEWSPYALAHSVAPAGTVLGVDARQAQSHLGARAFGAVVSLDFLEHFPPADTTLLIEQSFHMTRPGGLAVHLIGAHDPADDLSNHLSDPSHVNHEPLGWYKRQFQDAGFMYRPDLTFELNTVPAWIHTDWNGRIMAFVRPVLSSGLVLP